MTPKGSEVSAYDRLRHDDQQLCALLAAGKLERELQAVFGPALHRELARLARRAARRPPSHATTVIVVPGILGSQLGELRTAPLPPDLLWLDPQDVLAGRLMHLRLPGAALVPLGALPFSYLPLRLRLQAAGYEVAVHDYDWRLDLGTLAAALAARVRAIAGPVSIIAHSMGGLLARAALPALAGVPLERLVLLGVPQRGAFGALQALRGSYPVVRRLAALDAGHDADSLASEVFASFPSLYQLLPDADWAGLDLHDVTRWPAQGPQPDAALLQQARGFLASLPAPDARCFQVVGTGQRTVTGLGPGAGAAVGVDGFRYEIDSLGDGTVACTSAALPGVATWALHCEHSRLPRDARVGRALLALLAGREPTQLARLALPATSQPRRVHVDDRELARNWNTKVDWGRLAADARREYLENLNLPPPQYAARGPRVPAP
ncbi:MAG: hypothetical protein RL684_1640 [Pseudomonadota bacterium]|jgi:hypothetical protein